MKFLSLMVIAVSVALSVARASPVSAQMASTPMLCEKRAKLMETLNHRFQETPTSLGLANTGAIAELLTSEDGSWSIVLTYPQGFSCIVATGRHWQQREKEIAGFKM